MASAKPTSDVIQKHISEAYILTVSSTQQDVQATQSVNIDCFSGPVQGDACAMCMKNEQANFDDGTYKSLQFYKPGLLSSNIRIKEEVVRLCKQFCYCEVGNISIGGSFYVDFSAAQKIMTDNDEFEKNFADNLVSVINSAMLKAKTKRTKTSSTTVNGKTVEDDPMDTVRTHAKNFAKSIKTANLTSSIHQSMKSRQTIVFKNEDVSNVDIEQGIDIVSRAIQGSSNTDVMKALQQLQGSMGEVAFAISASAANAAIKGIIQWTMVLLLIILGAICVYLFFDLFSAIANV